MDICMLTPAEREEVQKLIAEYHKAGERLQLFLETVGHEWAEEGADDDIDARSDEMLDQMVYRVDRLGRWIEQIAKGRIDFEEIDIPFEFDDEEEE